MQTAKQTVIYGFSLCAYISSLVECSFWVFNVLFLLQKYCELGLEISQKCFKV